MHEQRRRAANFSMLQVLILATLAWARIADSALRGGHISGRLTAAAASTQASATAAADFEHCDFEITMLDTRGIPSQELPPSRAKYWAVTAAINYAYAKRFGYGFNFVVPELGNVSGADGAASTTTSSGYAPNWLKPLYLAERLSQLADRGKCAWLLYMDSDSFVREPDVPLHAFLGDITSRYNIKKDIGAVFAHEDSRYRHVNTGVILLQANAQSRQLLDAWLRDGARDDRVRNTWPFDQGTLTELVFPGKYNTTRPAGHAQVQTHAGLDIDSAVALVNFTEMNGPHGNFVRHLYRDQDQHRQSKFVNMLARLNLEGIDSFTQITRELRSHAVKWTPGKF